MVGKLLPGKGWINIVTEPMAGDVYCKYISVSELFNNLVENTTVKARCVNKQDGVLVGGLNRLPVVDIEPGGPNVHQFGRAWSHFISSLTDQHHSPLFENPAPALVSWRQSARELSCRRPSQVPGTVELA